MTKAIVVAILLVCLLLCSSLAENPVADHLTSIKVDASFDWHLERASDVEISFSDDMNTGTSDIMLHYNISRRHDAKVEAFESDCATAIPSNVVTLSSTAVAATRSGHYSDLAVQVSLVHDNITTFPNVWDELDDEEGRGVVSLCIRVDLMLSNTSTASLTFLEQKIYIDIGGLLKGFEVLGIDSGAHHTLNKKNEEAGLP